jgi:small-conductance mechanosensitive channel
MEKFTQFLTSMPAPLRILGFVLIAVLSHFKVRAIRKLDEWILTLRVRKEIPVQETFTRKFPKTATLLTILVSSITFSIYFVAVGFILREFKVSLKAYLASASVIGLAVGFGTQGFVQDVISGLTLIFSDALNIEDVFEISGQVGRVEKIGLRFTTIVNFRGQRLSLPNRNIGMISRFHRGVIRAYVDIQIPPEVEEKSVTKALKTVAEATHSQHKAVIVSEPVILGVFPVENMAWKYLRIKFSVWPGQESLIDSIFRQRMIAMMKQYTPEYADWMVVASYKVQEA